MAELKERTYLRSIALQVLYENDLSEHELPLILQNRFEAIELDNESQAFVRQLVMGVHDHREAIDALIEKYAVDWPLDQIPTIDCNLIRIAAYEFAISGKTPDKVAINESVELAKTFGSESAPRFVNGVLGAIADNRS